MIRVRMREADKMECPLTDNFEDARSRFTRRRVRVYNTDSTTGKSDYDRVTAPRLVEINPEIFRIWRR